MTKVSKALARFAVALSVHQDAVCLAERSRIGCAYRTLFQMSEQIEHQRLNFRGANTFYSAATHQAICNKATSERSQ